MTTMSDTPTLLVPPSFGPTSSHTRPSSKRYHSYNDATISTSSSSSSSTSTSISYRPYPLPSTMTLPTRSNPATPSVGSGPSRPTLKRPSPTRAHSFCASTPNCTYALASTPTRHLDETKRSLVAPPLERTISSFGKVGNGLWRNEQLVGPGLMVEGGVGRSEEVVGMQVQADGPGHEDDLTRRESGSARGQAVEIWRDGVFDARTHSSTNEVRPTTLSWTDEQPGPSSSPTSLPSPPIPTIVVDLSSPPRRPPNRSARYPSDDQCTNDAQTGRPPFCASESRSSSTSSIAPVTPISSIVFGARNLQSATSSWSQAQKGQTGVEVADAIDGDEVEMIVDGIEEVVIT